MVNYTVQFTQTVDPANPTSTSVNQALITNTQGETRTVDARLYIKLVEHFRHQILDQQIEAELLDKSVTVLELQVKKGDTEAKALLQRLSELETIIRDYLKAPDVWLQEQLTQLNPIAESFVATATPEEQHGYTVLTAIHNGLYGGADALIFTEDGVQVRPVLEAEENTPLEDVLSLIQSAAATDSAEPAAPAAPAAPAVESPLPGLEFPAPDNQTF